MVDCVIALDIGGTKMAAAVVAPDGAVLARRSVATPGSVGAQAILDAAADLVAELSADHSDDAGSVAALGVGSAGVINAESGVVLGATELLRGWSGTHLRGSLSMATGLPTAVINDVHAHALGESLFGAGRGAQTMLFVAVGTGVGGSFVINGSVVPGAHSAAGHLGHQASPYATDVACTCGGVGHLEAAASGPALVAHYNRASGASVARFEEVVSRAARGDEFACETVELGGSAVGSAIGGLINVLDPEIVVVGGGVGQAGDLWWTAVHDLVQAEALPSLAAVAVVPARLGTDAALLGAAALAWEVAP